MNTLFEEVPTNLTWAEEEVGLWKAWIYDPYINRYYFDDFGNESFSALWNDPFLARVDEKF